MIIFVSFNPTNYHVIILEFFQSFAGFWYPADKICISLVYIIGTNIETKEKNTGRAYTGLNLVIFIEEHVHL